MSRPQDRPDLPEKPMTPQQSYNLVTDTVGGVNVRFRDNLFQAVAIAVCLALGVLIGWVAVADQPMGLLLGGFIGLLVGLFGSGIFLMVYRMVKHSRGQHD